MTNNSNQSYPYFVIGKVVKGYGRGSKQLGCPTANIDSDIVNKIILPNGIYYGFAQLEVSSCNFKTVVNPPLQFSDEERKPNGTITNGSNGLCSKISPVYMMCCSFGNNPYFNNTEKSLEVHIINDFGYDFYGSTLRVAICGFIRGEKSFSSLDELKAAIKNDIDFTKNELNNVKWKTVSESKELFLL